MHERLQGMLAQHGSQTCLLGPPVLLNVPLAGAGLAIMPSWTLDLVPMTMVYLYVYFYAPCAGSARRR